MRTACKYAVSVFDLGYTKNRIDFLEEELKKEAVYSDVSLSTTYSKELTRLKNEVKVYDDLQFELELATLAIEEGVATQVTSESQILDTMSMIQDLKSKVDEFLITTLLSGKYDSSNAIIKLHSGAGGTEACDWVAMVYRMYTMYCNKKGFKITELDELAGDGAGYKSVTFKVTGENAYGYLKGEHGVHRLVRISPFDANKRRHTSFLSVEVMPEIDSDDEIVIDEKDIRVDTYRASGAGGQHINKTDSAIRITHFPTGIVVTCQNERSQFQNREMAYRMLKSKLLALKLEEEQKEADRLKGIVRKIEWGSQIRSYVFCPYTMVKDHRTGCETSNVQAVMNGGIDEFVSAYLRYEHQEIE